MTVSRSTTNAALKLALFAMFILAPSIGQLFNVGQSNTENRTLAPFPELRSLKEIKDLPRLAENYVNDRFGFRHQLVHLNSMVRYALGLSSAKEVVIGSDGWLFYTADQILEQHTGANVFDHEELERWVRQMEADRDWLAKRGISLLILIAPEKSTIYPEKLPDYPRRPGATTRLDQLAERLRQSNLDFVDPRAELLKAKERGVQVYFEGDSHWTQRGAFIVYSIVMDHVRTRLPDLPAKTLEDYDVAWGPAPASDLAYLLTLDQDLHYEVEHFSLRGPPHELAARTTSRSGWPWRIVEVSTDLKDRPRLMVMGDSFVDYVLGPQFLYETFRDPVWTHHNLGMFDFNLVKEVKPDLVIVEFAERYLHASLGTPVGMDESR
jgi:alginate O-acetyltransferase complex protein AlgJ